MTTEKSPLLDHQNHGDGSSEHRGVTPLTPPQDIYVPAIGPDELPPPYSAVDGGSLMIACKVCSCMIDISTKRNQHVVKCMNCNEATPIKPAPPGKRYVRCTCNCLLICKSSSERVACPRENCTNIINLTPHQAIMPNVPGMCQVSCGHCHSSFLFNSLNTAFARCPHCQKVSSVGASYARRRAFVYLTVCIFCLLTFSIVISTTYNYANHHGGIFVVWIGLPLASLILLVYSLRFFCMRISSIEGSI